MKLNQIYIPSTHPNPASVSTVTLIHGWGAESRIWQDWATQYLAPLHHVVLIDLPGFGDSPVALSTDNSTTLESLWLEALSAALPDKSHLLGWSLGGLLAQKLAVQCPEKVMSLVCLASTPRFTQNDGWTRSVSPQIIGDFIKSIGIEASAVLKKFWRLQLQGSDNSRVLMKDLVKHMSSRKLPKLSSLNQGLILLRDMDNRALLKQITQPTCWVLGEKDPLIPQDIRLNLQQLQPLASIEIIMGGSHIPFFSHPEETSQILLDFWATQDNNAKF